MNGWLYINKDAGMTSFDVVAQVRRRLGVRRVGHTGTLDPLARGLLVIAVGAASRLIPYTSAQQKEYTFELVWGQERMTDDAEGEVMCESHVRPTRDQVEGALSDFTGIIQQTPPVYSAIKVNGKRAYALARAGKNVDLKARAVEIYDLRLISHAEDRSFFKVVCGSGTYIRSLGRDIARSLNSCGYIENLVRTRIGMIACADTVSLDALPDGLRSIESCWEASMIECLEEDWGEIKHGRQLKLKGLESAEACLLCCKGKGYAVGPVEGYYFVPKRVMAL
ncbi:MAG: tRNA pseudouridine(55) synthase TruB [Alphaproteobacteria bacterium]|nr:tRNA pseudouridine(55) synthase TruB [Alphaproteobacteria bacterium]